MPCPCRFVFSRQPLIRREIFKQEGALRREFSEDGDIRSGTKAFPYQLSVAPLENKKED